MIKYIVAYAFMKSNAVPRVTKTLAMDIQIIRGLMKLKGITARKASEDLGTSYSNISKVLTGVLESKSLMKRLMDYLRELPTPKKMQKRHPRRKIITAPKH